MKYLDRIANGAIIVAVAVFPALVARGEFLRHKTTAPLTPGSATALVGKTISVPGVHFSGGEDSVVLGISATCHYCKDSLPFYKELTAQAKGKVNVIAVLPQAQTDAEAYVKNAGLMGTEVVSGSLADIGVYGTPTLLLVDGKGKVRSVWVGKQDEAGQRKILAAVLPTVASAVPRGNPRGNIR